MDVDYIVVGAGIAGLTSAYELAQQGSVWVLSKSSPANITTTWAKGGIASVMSPSDSVHLHRQDTLIAGCGRCDPDRVDILVTEGPDRIQDLVAMGVDFDREPGTARGFHLGHEAAHQQRRILHVGDQTGRNVHAAMYRAASQHSRIKIWDQATVVELLCHAGTHGVRQCYGCVVYVNGQRHTMQAKAVVLATGGAAHMYAQTSAPAGCYGDGIGLAHQAGAAIRDMAFVQFHPTVLYGTNFLVSEVVRGEGVMNYSDNGRYIGYWSDEKRHGGGIMNWSKGRTYQGGWTNGQPDGFGRMEWPGGGSYEGHFIRGQRHGLGTMIWLDGRRYEGDWKRGLPMAEWMGIHGEMAHE